MSLSKGHSPRAHGAASFRRNFIGGFMLWKVFGFVGVARLKVLVSRVAKAMG